MGRCDLIHYFPDAVMEDQVCLSFHCHPQKEAYLIINVQMTPPRCRMGDYL